MKNFSVQNSKLLRWSLKLSDLDFFVEHRPGSRMGHVDALSRHVGAVIQENPLDKENVRREQAKDTFCSKQSPGTYRSKQEIFLDSDGILYKRKSNAKHQLIVPETLISEVIKENHDPVYISHPGTKRTYDLISLRYWWPGMRKSIEDFIKNCDSCKWRKKDNENIASEVSDLRGQFRKLEARLKEVYELVAKLNRKSHQRNKRLYDRRAKVRKFEVEDLVYLYNPKMKVGLTRKFFFPWIGPFKITKKISDLKYEIVIQNDKRQVVYINRLKKCYNQDLWKPKTRQKTVKQPPKRSTKRSDQDEESELQFRRFLLEITDDLNDPTTCETLSDQTLDIPSPAEQTLDTPTSERTDPNYSPPTTPKSRRELQITRAEPPITRSRTRIMSQELADTQPT